MTDPSDTSLLTQTTFLLAAIVFTVLLFKRIGLGTVLGYFAAGLALGPWGFRIITDSAAILHVAELGVVLLLFVIGLELQPRRLWALRRPIFGWGGSQLGLTAAVLTPLGVALGLSWTAALVIAVALSLSSTAIAIQTLAERKQLTTQHGRLAFAILLFQDMAVIPVLALIPLLAGGAMGVTSHPEPAAITTALIAIAVVIGGGHFLLRPFFRAIASAHSFELFSAASLLVVVGIAALMDSVGLSMALGSFLAGVLLADSEFRHELEANIEPFKGLLLGLFFAAVGMSVDLGVILRDPLLVMGLALTLIAIKFTVVFVLGVALKKDSAVAGTLATTLAQGGEFGFVVFTLAASGKLISPEQHNILIAVVSVSMALAPAAFAVNDWIGRIRKKTTSAAPYDTVQNDDPRVIIAGFGRFGQILARVLSIKNIPFTALDKDFAQIDFVRRFGSKAYYGDATRLDLLRAAGIDKAKVLVIAVDDIEASITIAQTVKRHYPQVRIFARARNRRHVYRLRDIGVDVSVRETFHSSLELTRAVLANLLGSPQWADDVVQRFRQHDEALLNEQQQFHQDEERLIQATKQASAELKELFERDTAQRIADTGKLP